MRIISPSLRRGAFGFLVIAVGAHAARGQNFNIDVGLTPEPVPLYPGAAMQPGHWNPISADAVGVALINTASMATGVTVTTAGAVGNDFVDDPGTAAGSAADLLMDDFQDVGGAGAVASWTFIGLSDGMYEVTTYAWAPGEPTFLTAVTPGCSSESAEIVGGPWPGVHVRGITYSLHRVRVAAGDPLTLTAETASGDSGRINGFQLKKMPSAGVADCFGDGTDEDCPCLNFGVAGHGCENSFGTGGGQLTAYGLADVSVDSGATGPSLFLAVTDSTPVGLVLFVQGTAALDPDADGLFGVAANDGLSCIGGTLIRLGRKPGSCGQASLPAPGDPPISILGGIPAAGGTFYYQALYRNTAVYCTAATYNYTNALSITWVM